jgi:hypothetical protein
LKFHDLLKKRNYRLLYSAGRKGKPGPKGPPPELIKAIVELKQRNPRFGCLGIAQQIAKAFEVDIDKDIVRRVLAKHYRPMHDDDGPLWLTLPGHTKDKHVHQSLDGDAPAEASGAHQPLAAKLSNYSRISHCNGLFQTPIAA